MVIIVIMIQMNFKNEFNSSFLFYLLIYSMDRDDIKKQMYDITAVLIDRLQMMRLWGYGFPDIPLYVFILRHYLQYFSYFLLIQ